MSVTNSQYGTRVDEIGDSTFRISTRSPDSGAALGVHDSPALRACTHGAAFRGDGAAALRALARVLAG
jgi:hypothetical protein